MAHPIKSEYELLMDRLRSNNQVSTLDEKITRRIRKEIAEDMDACYFEKQRKAAQSEKHAAEVILTA